MISGINSPKDELTTLVRKDQLEIGSQGDWVNRLPVTLTNVMPGANRDDIANYIEGMRHEGLGLSFLQFAHKDLANLVKRAPQMEKEDLIEQLQRMTDALGKGIQRANNNFKTYMANLFEHTAIRPCDESPKSSAA